VSNKDVELAKTEGRFRDGKRNKIEVPKEPRNVKIKCMYPPCAMQVAVAAPPEGVAAGSIGHVQKLGGMPMCSKHGEWLQFYVWCQMSIKLEAQRTASGLVLPGNPNYQTTIKQGPTAQGNLSRG